MQMSSICKILTANCKRYTFEYIPTRELWNTLKHQTLIKKSCLTIDCHNFNSLGSLKFRTNAESGTEQICYYNRNTKDKSFNRFLALRKQTTNESIIFEIKNIVEETKTGSFDCYDINNKLEEFNDGRADDNRTTLKRSISELSSANIRGGKFIKKKTKFLSR